MESEADNRTVSVVGVRGFKQSCGSWSTADALKSVIDDVQGVVSFKEKNLHLLCLLYKITVIRAHTMKKYLFEAKYLGVELTEKPH